MVPIHRPFCWEYWPCFDLLCPQIVSCPALVKQTEKRLRVDRQTLTMAWKILFHGTACASHAVSLRLEKKKKGLINVRRLKPDKNFILYFLRMNGNHCGLRDSRRHTGFFSHSHTRNLHLLLMNRSTVELIKRVLEAAPNVGLNPDLLKRSRPCTETPNGNPPLGGR